MVVVPDVVVIVTAVAAAVEAVGLLAVATPECIGRPEFPNIAAARLANVRRIFVAPECVGQSPVPMAAAMRAPDGGIRPCPVARAIRSRVGSLEVRMNETVESPPRCAHFAIADSSSAIRRCPRRVPAADCASGIAAIVDIVALAQCRAANTDRFGTSVWRSSSCFPPQLDCCCSHTYSQRMNEMNESEIKYRLRGTQQNIFKETLDLPKAAVDGSFRIFGRRSVLFFDLDPNIVAELLELLVQLFDELDVVGGQTFEHVHNALWRFVWLVE